MAFMVRHIRKLSRGRVVAQKAMIPGSAACKVTQAGNLTEKWQFSIFFQGHICHCVNYRLLVGIELGRAFP